MPMAETRTAGPRAGPPIPEAAEGDAPHSPGLSVASLERLARERRRALLAAAHLRCSRPQDAEDAVQEALRIALERRTTIRPATAFAYVATIAMHESSRLRRLAERARSLDTPVGAAEARRRLDGKAAVTQDLDAAIDALDVLGELKPDHARALMARALGWSYAEIGEAFGWTYTKTNRCLTEGRAAARAGAAS